MRRSMGVAWLAFCMLAVAQEEGESSSEAGGEDGEGGKGKSQREISAQYTYCAEDDCYELLGVTRENGAIAIKRAYRRLAAEWHPDKNPDPRAKELFQKYANAYEVLSSAQMRKNYDYLLDHPYEFPMHYLRFSKAKYAPKTDLRMVLFFTLLLMSAVQYFVKKQQYESTIKAIKASARYQERLKALMVEEKKSPGKMLGRQMGGSSKTVKKDKTSDEKKKAAEDILEAELAEDLTEPKYQETLIFAAFAMPLTTVQMVQFQLSWFMKFTINKEEYGPEEIVYLTKRALKMSDADWKATSEEEQEELMAMELWVSDNLAAYEDELAARENAEKKSSAKHKREVRIKKKGGTGVVMNDN